MARKGTYPHSIGSQSGFGMVEVLVGLVVISILATVTVFYSDVINLVSRETRGDRYNCVNHGNAVLSKFRGSLGEKTVRMYYPPRGTANGNRRPVPAATPTSLTQVMGNGTAANVNNIMWATVPDTISINTGGFNPNLGAANQFRLANATLIEGGPMRALSAMYNNIITTTGTCDNFVSPYTAFTNMSANNVDSFLMKTSVAAGNRPTTQLRIRRFNIDTGQVIAGCPITWARPPGKAPEADGNINAFGVNGGGGIPIAAEQSAAVGFLLEIQTTYFTAEDEANARTCVVSQRFSYERDTGAPAVPTVSLDITTPGANMVDFATANQHTMTMQIDSAQAEPGVVMACRDRSVRLNPGPHACYVQAAAMPGPGNQWPPIAGFPRGDPRVIAHNAAETDTGPTMTTQQLTAVAVARPWSNVLWKAGNGTGSEWGPCEEISVCGRAPAGGAVTQPAGTNDIQITNNYTNLPSDCVIRVEAVTIDTAGNLSNVGYGAFNPTQTSSIEIGNNTNVGRPTCGTTFCTYAGNSYYQDGACCVGGGCVAGQVGDPSGPIRSLSNPP